MLNLLVNPDDRAALRAWIGLGQRQHGFAPGYRRIQRYAQEQALEPRQVLEQLCKSALRLPSTKGIVRRYCQLEERLSTLRGLTGVDLVSALWSPDDDESADVRDSATQLAGEYPQAEALYSALLREITQPELPGSDSDIIRVMSLHKSKGLTAALVVVAGCVSGALPTIDREAPHATQDFQREEQRRLFYVAITRATDTLVISSSVSMLSRDALSNGIDVQRHVQRGAAKMAATSASPFIVELGPAAPATITAAQWRIQANF